MKKSEMLKIELEQCTAEKDEAYIREVIQKKGTDTRDCLWKRYYDSVGSSLCRKEEQLQRDIRKEINRELEVGDGVRLCLYSDIQSHTIVGRTKCTLTIQRDKATRNFKPEWVPGGFSAICTNNDSQEWTIEPDPNGTKTLCRWSEKYGCWTTGGDQTIRIYAGRFEHYDYNF